MSAASPPGSAPKSMSSRLLTMKFMQRAANSSPSVSSPTTPEQPSPKRRRTDSDASPSRANIDSLADRAAVQAALANEEAKRQLALEKQAAEAGDTRWVLSFEDQRHSTVAPELTLRVVQTGFATLDTSPSQTRHLDDDIEDVPVMVGRRSFGRFNKILEKQQDPSLEDSSESGSEDDEDDSEDSGSDADDPTSELIKSSRQEAAERAKTERKAKKRAAKEQLEGIAKKRRKKDVNLNGDYALNGLSSLSGRQDRKISIPPACYNCGGPHMKRDCPKLKRGYQGEDDGPPRKALRAK